MVVRVGLIDRKGIYSLFDYQHKSVNCKAIRLRIYIADNSATPPPNRLTTAKGTKKEKFQRTSLFSTRSRGRTGTSLLTLVFETNASTDSAIRAILESGVQMYE